MGTIWAPLDEYPWPLDVVVPSFKVRIGLSTSGRFRLETFPGGTSCFGETVEMGALGCWPLVLVSSQSGQDQRRGTRRSYLSGGYGFGMASASSGCLYQLIVMLGQQPSRTTWPRCLGVYARHNDFF